MKNIVFFTLIFFITFIPLAHSKKQSATVAVEVPPNTWKTMRLKNLPQHSAVQVELACQCNISVDIVDEKNYEIYPDIKRPLFHSDVKDKIMFAVTIPSTGHYYLIFTNPSSVHEVKLDVTITGATGADALILQEEETAEDQEQVVEKTLDQISDELKKLFIFKNFPISAKKCGREAAFSGPDGVILCTEFAQKILTTVGSKEKSADVLLFTIFHEIGHILLSQWGYPFYDNEDIADEFATVLLIMFGFNERLNAVTEFFISDPTSDELMKKALRGDRHQLSIQRARNIVEWRKNADRIKRWQNIFIPHMQKSVLVKLKKTTPAGYNLSLIEKELELRKQ